MICPYASELGDDEGIPSGPMMAIRKRELAPLPHIAPFEVLAKSVALPLLPKPAKPRRIQRSSVTAREMAELRHKLCVAFPAAHSFRKGNDFARKRKAVAA